MPRIIETNILATDETRQLFLKYENEIGVMVMSTVTEQDDYEEDYIVIFVDENKNMSAQGIIQRFRDKTGLDIQITKDEYEMDWEDLK